MATDKRSASSHLSFKDLDSRVRSAWAKSAPNPAPDGQITHWLPVHRHLADTAGIAALLWDEWLSPNTKRIISDAVGDEQAARTLAIWLAGCHDLGKISPAFAVQVEKLADRMDLAGLHTDRSIAGTEQRRQRRHELVGHLSIQDFLVRHHGFSAERAHQIASVVAAHHGRPPSWEMVLDARHDTRHVGDETWFNAREQLLMVMTAQLTSPRDLDVWRDADLPAFALVPLSAFVVVADWIASSDTYFPLAELGKQDVDAADRIEDAWRKLALPAPWRPQAPEDDATLFFERFGFTTANSMQAEAMQAARTCDSPPLMIIESAMGSGKTEAALAVAEILATRFEMSGIFIGLPTQATADGMFARALTWAKHLGLETPMNLFLGHGKSDLNEEFDRLRSLGRLNSLGDSYTRADRWADQREAAVPHEWFSNSRKGPLADLAVGTIDQSLLAMLVSKHNAMRHLALTSKVVILDEVHAFDAFTSVYLEQLLRWFGAYRVPVILLSATLPDERRHAFLEAYEDGRAQGQGIRRKRTKVGGAGSIGYPAITITSGSGARTIEPSSTAESKSIAVERIRDDADLLASRLEEELADGGCAVVIHNTVRRVQETASVLRERLNGIPVVVAHSRFLGIDRAKKDAELLRLFGKDSESRPDRMVVVASQVVEQSLDIDFDLMVTDLAPIDLVLQRAGRLHRHERVRPPRLRMPRLLLTGADWDATPPKPNRGSQLIYQAYPLLRTLAALGSRKQITLPDDIPMLVRRAYGPEVEIPEAWVADVDAARHEFERTKHTKTDQARTFRVRDPRKIASLIGWSDGSAGDPSNDTVAEASVRDGEPSLEVLVLQRIDGVLVTPTWYESGGDQLPENDLPTRAQTRAILGSSLRLPAAMCREREIDGHIDELERNYPVQAWHRSYALRGELILVFDEDRTATLGEYHLVYDPIEGLTYEAAGSRNGSENLR